MPRSDNYIAIAPGASIKEQLLIRNMSQKEFSKRMGMSQKYISELINDEVQLTYDVASKLEMVLGLNSSFWNHLEALYREELVKVEKENLIVE